MALPADPRDRLAQIHEKGLRKMYMPQSIPVEEVDAEKESAKAPTIVIVKGGSAKLGELLRSILG